MGEVFEIYRILSEVKDPVIKELLDMAAHEFGLSRPSFYRAQTTFQQGGLSGLIPLKRGPRQAHKLTPEVLQFLDPIRAADHSLGWPELAGRIREHFGIQV